MKQLTAFTKKEFMEITRTGKIYIVVIIFVIFGILNPGIAKLTPWLYEMLSESLKEQGLSIGDIGVTAMTSWEQYYKNMSMEFIVYILMFCGTLTAEYKKGTLINMLTKGLPRWKVIASKFISMIISWSLCYWIGFFVTFGYTAYFWDNSIAEHFVFAAIMSYLFGIWLISLILFFSVFINSSSGVLLATGALYVICNLIGMIPKTAEYLPTKLLSGMALLTKTSSVSDYTNAILITITLIVIAGFIATIGFNKNRM